jgi:hypothetical protein
VWRMCLDQSPRCIECRQREKTCPASRWFRISALRRSAVPAAGRLLVPDHEAASSCWRCVRSIIRSIDVRLYRQCPLGIM